MMEENFMQKRPIRLLSLLLAVLLISGLSSSLTASGEEVRYEAVTEIKNTYRYVLATKDQRSSGAGNRVLLLPEASESEEQGLNFTDFSVSEIEKQESKSFWQILPQSETTCYLRSLGLSGEERYINISASGVTLGRQQLLNMTQTADGSVQFSVEEDGKTIYLRFIGSKVGARFGSGTLTSGSEFTLYRRAVMATSGSSDPLLTVACISDLHIDYGIQNWEVPLRQGIIDTCKAIGETEDADILLVGGDITSDNAKTGGWPKATFERVKQALDSTLRSAVSSGRVLYAAGNHENQVGVSGKYNSYDYEDLMIAALGEFDHAYYQADDPSLKNHQYPRHLLGYHYEVEGYDFIVLNPVYGGTTNFTSGTLEWFQDVLEEIGKDRRVFVMSHFPFRDSKNISTPEYGHNTEADRKIKNILLQYPNVIYLYGHNHGQAESVYIHNDTFERVTPYNTDGSIVKSADQMPESFVSSFMGSMGYYKVAFNSDWLSESQPAVVQALMIYVYEDRVEFQMKNYGSKNGGSEELTPYILSSGTYVLEEEMTPEEADLPRGSDSLEGLSPVAVSLIIGGVIVVAAAVGAVFLLRKKKQ